MLAMPALLGRESLLSVLLGVLLRHIPTFRFYTVWFSVPAIKRNPTRQVMYRNPANLNGTQNCRWELMDLFLNLLSEKKKTNKQTNLTPNTMLRMFLSFLNCLD